MVFSFCVVRGLWALDMLAYFINKGNLVTYAIAYLLNNTQSSITIRE